MSSTNKTANLGLNKWALTDPFETNDFNQDNAKIDAAMGIRPWVTIMDVTTTQPVNTVEINIDPAKYLSLKLYQISNTPPLWIYLRINKDTRAYDTYSYFSGEWSTSTNYCFFDGGSVDFDLCGDMIYMKSITRSYRPYHLKTQIVTTIDMMRDTNGGSSFPVGTRFVLTGVKK